MTVEQAETGTIALHAKAAFRPDVCVVSQQLPDVDGMAVVERLAEQGDCGIILLTPRPQQSVVMGLECGADDVVNRPPQVVELTARIRAVHRRFRRSAGPGGVEAADDTGPQVMLDAATRSIVGAGDIRTLLTEAEYAAIETLVEADGASVSREWLGRVALKRTVAASDRSVDQLVLKLRRKLAMHGLSNRIILSSRGLGYVIPDPARFRIINTLF